MKQNKLNLKDKTTQDLHWLLHTMRVYHASADKRKQVIDEINKRDKIWNTHAKNVEKISLVI